MTVGPNVRLSHLLALQKDGASWEGRIPTCEQALLSHYRNKRSGNISDNHRKLNVKLENPPKVKSCQTWGLGQDWDIPCTAEPAVSTVHLLGFFQSHSYIWKTYMHIMYNKYIILILHIIFYMLKTHTHVYADIFFLIMKSWPLDLANSPAMPHLWLLAPTYAVLKPGWRRRPLWQGPGGRGNCCASWLLPVGRKVPKVRDLHAQKRPKTRFQPNHGLEALKFLT